MAFDFNTSGRLTFFPFLKATIEKINTLNIEQRKGMYREILQNGEFSNKGGAGLGMIDIAIKANAQLNYDFKEYNNEDSFYVFQLNIHK